jgi:hypothetical protein
MARTAQGIEAEILFRKEKIAAESPTRRLPKAGGGMRP